MTEAPKKQLGRILLQQRALTAEQEHRLGLLLLVQPDATLAELQTALPTTAALSTLWRAIGRFGLTFKKNGLRRRTTTP